MDAKKGIIEGFEIRPRFKLSTNISVKEGLGLVKNGVEDVQINQEKVRCRITHTHAHFSVPAAFEHYWSPVLHVGFERESEDESTTLHCLIGPKQGVWAMFALIYAAIGILVIFGALYGGAKYQLEGDATFLWLALVGVFLFLVTFIGVKIGQQKGQHQTMELLKFLWVILKDAKVKQI